MAQALHPAAGQGSEISPSIFAVAGLAQYLTVGLYMVFFGTYSFDFYWLLRRTTDERRAGAVGHCDSSEAEDNMERKDVVALIRE